LVKILVGVGIAFLFYMFMEFCKSQTHTTRFQRRDLLLVVASAERNVVAIAHYISFFKATPRHAHYFIVSATLRYLAHRLCPITGLNRSIRKLVDDETR
jgi:hypothetical protein